MRRISSLPDNEAGFSLIELLVVLAIMALGASMIAPSFGRLGGGDDAQQAEQRWLQNIRDGQKTAMIQGRMITIAGQGPKMPEVQIFPDGSVLGAPDILSPITGRRMEGPSS